MRLLIKNWPLFVSKKQEETGVYRYKTKFQMQRNEQERLNSLISNMNEGLKNNSIPTDVNTFSGSVQEFFERT